MAERWSMRVNIMRSDKITVAQNLQMPHIAEVQQQIDRDFLSLLFQEGSMAGCIVLVSIFSQKAQERIPTTHSAAALGAAGQAVVCECMQDFVCRGLQDTTLKTRSVAGNPRSDVGTGALLYLKGSLQDA
ncbi:hypothetical protein cyc_03419 [Cyclospora cayetanensis]|uniref:Uncharacterized protein n=1 Tax=Cyclospora cayetanensis TaxID=88456 RepID=A0A1D3CWG0_9EIME|nr:hypothetical protein cyc_03419 [Cyclospora cayetanensis]